MQAIILSGGRGERLDPLTSFCPKGMIKVNGKPLLEYHLEWLKNYGIKKVIFACGYLSEEIQDYFQDGKKFSIEITYSIEDEQLGRGGAINRAWEMLNLDEMFIVTNGDIYTEMNLKKAINFHKSQSGKATICLFPYKSSYGIVNFNDNNQVEKFNEKPALPYWINGGIYIFEYDLKKYFPHKGDHEITVFPVLSQEKLLYCYKSTEYWRSIETIKDLSEFSFEMEKQLSTKNLCLSS